MPKKTISQEQINYFNSFNNGRPLEISDVEDLADLLFIMMAPKEHRLVVRLDKYYNCGIVGLRGTSNMFYISQKKVGVRDSIYASQGNAKVVYAFIDGASIEFKTKVRTILDKLNYSCIDRI